MSQGINNDMTASKPRHIVKNLRWWMLVLFLLGVTVNYITRNSLGILAPELKSSLGITTIFLDCRCFPTRLYPISTVMRVAD
mgnify:CR=1 FL=1